MATDNNLAMPSWPPPPNFLSMVKNAYNNLNLTTTTAALSRLNLVSTTTMTWSSISTLLSSKLLVQLTKFALFFSLFWFLYRLWTARRFFRRLQACGMPMPPHHFLFGHLGLMLKIMLSLPSDVMPVVALGHQIRLRFPELDRAFYLDLWPVAKPALVVLAPDLHRQFAQTDAPLGKVSFLGNYLKPISGGHDLVSMEGAEWKRWAEVFRPGFSRLAETAVPQLLESVSRFREVLTTYAEKDNKGKDKDEGVLQLHHAILKLAVDMAAKAVWGYDMNCQTAYDDMADAVVSQLKWLNVEGFMPFASLNLARPLVHWYNGRRMERYIDRVEAQESQAAGVKSVKFAGDPDQDGGGGIMGRVIRRLQSREPREPLGLSDEARRVMRSQKRFLILAAYDTTASTITYVLHTLHKYPDVLARLRAEHDAVLGPDVGEAPEKLRAQPHLVHRVPYTTAVIKEVLRLYPPSSTLREGRAGFFLRDVETSEDGRQRLLKRTYPTEGCMLFGNHHALHHNPRYWPDPERFIPERFMSCTRPGDRLYPVADAWRPFEKGPRVCMGQELAMVEITLVLLLVAREFEFRPAYEEWDRDGQRKQTSAIGLAVLLPGWMRGEESKQVDGERAYQTTGGGGSHPADGYPSRVRLASRG